jgi:hypothetical protein
VDDIVRNEKKVFAPGNGEVGDEKNIARRERETGLGEIKKRRNLPYGSWHNPFGSWHD